MKFGLCPSVNGYGHVRRTCSLAKALLRKGHEADIIFPSYVSSNQINIARELNLKFLVIEISETLKQNLINEGPFVNLEFENRDYFKLPVETLGSYDCLIVDTITWPARFNERNILLAQFCWNNNLIESKNEINASKMDLKNFDVIYGIDIFAWQNIKLLPNYIGIKPLDYWGLRNISSVNMKKELGIANNGTSFSFEKLLELPYPLTKVNGIPQFYYLKGYIPRIMLMRAGLGSILESLALGCHIVTVDSKNSLDVLHNEKILHGLGLAVKFENLDKDKLEDLMERTPNSLTEFDMMSMEEFCEILLQNIRGH